MLLWRDLGRIPSNHSPPSRPPSISGPAQAAVDRARRAEAVTAILSRPSYHQWIKIPDS